MHTYILLQELVQNRTRDRTLAHFPIKYEHFTQLDTAGLQTYVVYEFSALFTCDQNVLNINLTVFSLLFPP
jgi:hypothetical protein